MMLRKGDEEEDVASFEMNADSQMDPHDWQYLGLENYVLNKKLHILAVPRSYFFYLKSRCDYEIVLVL